MAASRRTVWAALPLAAALGLVAIHGPALRWSLGALPAYLGGGFPPLEERVLAAEATRAERFGEIDRARARVREARRIDPNHFALVEAEIERRAGRLDLAEAAYREALRADPLLVPAVLRLAALLEEQGRRGEARDLLRGALARVAAELRLQEPRPDPEVPERFNQKAREVHASYERGLAKLRAALRAASSGSSGSS